MDLEFTEEQQMIKDMARSILDEHSSVDTVRQLRNLFREEPRASFSELGGRQSPTALFWRKTPSGAPCGTASAKLDLSDHVSIQGLQFM